VKPCTVIEVDVLACCCISTEPVGASENCGTRSVMPRMVGTSKPFNVLEFVAVSSGSVWQPALESAHVSGSVTAPPLSTKYRAKPRRAAAVVALGVPSAFGTGTGDVAVETVSSMRRDRAGGYETARR
jgi:hypothetical protein